MVANRVGGGFQEARWLVIAFPTIRHFEFPPVYHFSKLPQSFQLVYSGQRQT